jgi:DNA-binding beta-propeller fold protein YncE
MGDGDDVAAGRRRPVGDGTDTGTVTATVLSMQRRLATLIRSTTIALTSDDQRVVAVNRENHSLAIIEVHYRKGADTAKLVAEVAVGNEPRFVALSSDDQEAYVLTPPAG